MPKPQTEALRELEKVASLTVTVTSRNVGSDSSAASNSAASEYHGTRTACASRKVTLKAPETPVQFSFCTSFSPNVSGLSPDDNARFLFSKSRRTDGRVAQKFNKSR